MNMRRIVLAAAAGTLTVAVALRAAPSGAAEGAVAASGAVPQGRPATATPIKHLVVIFNENVSFDHYFATYPNATNPPGEPAFTALPGTRR